MSDDEQYLKDHYMCEREIVQRNNRIAEREREIVQRDNCIAELLIDLRAKDAAHSAIEKERDEALTEIRKLEAERNNLRAIVKASIYLLHNDSCEYDDIRNYLDMAKNAIRL